MSDIAGNQGGDAMTGNEPPDQDDEAGKSSLETPDEESIDGEKLDDGEPEPSSPEPLAPNPDEPNPFVDGGGAAVAADV